jgi:electron transfer flavoprotein alpha subunit
MVTAIALDLAAAPAVRFRSYAEPEAGDVDITREQILVAVGRGIQQEENVALAEELAAALGGAVCGSRPVIDQGWLPVSRQVGASGMTVRPAFYLALGISGTPEHLVGVKDARLIIAINTDARAPIYGAAHYGAVADALEVLPALVETVRRRKKAT